MTADLDTRVRLHIYEAFVERGTPPTTGEAAGALEIPEADAIAAFRRLAEGRVIVLEPGSDDIWMANPMSARPTSFDVRAAGGGHWHGTCAWDAPGILAMLDTDGTVSTACPCCEAPLELEVREGDLRGPKGAVAHFLVPARRWWEDIGFT